MKYALIALSVVLTTAGLTRPEFAGRAAQLLIVGVTLLAVATLVHSLWEDVEPHIARPFVPPDPEVTSGIETPDVSELVRSIESSNGRIPDLVGKHVAEACRGRLADRHRLQFRSGADHDAIRAMLSPAMWQLLSTEPDDSIDVSIRNLPQLLDEVDAL
jgi:hypothetical protein